MSGDDPLEELDAELDSSVAGQFMLDTCVEHNVWCCPACFDMSPGLRVVITPRD